MKNINWMLLIIISGLMACSSVAYKEEIPINIIPKPVKIERSTGQVALDKGLRILAEKDNPGAQKISQILAEKLTRVLGWPVETEVTESNQSRKNTILLTHEGATLEKKESYILDVSNGVVLRADGESGLFYGMQTLMQLFPAQIYGNEPHDNLALILPKVRIEDYPAYSWRGLHLDVGRHMSSAEFIKDYLDYMAMHKLNTFHWHLTEDQGWRIEIKKYPKLTEIGAFRKETVIGHASKRPREFDGKPYGGFYTQDEVKDIVAYAAERYIAVVPEIEMPGHATAAIAAYPEFGTSGERPEVVTTFGIFPDIFSPEDKTFEFLQDVLTEVMDLFPSQYIHIGGDEALKEQWKASKTVQVKIKELGLKDEHELQSWFITKIEKFVNSKGRQIIGWDEILEGGLAPNAAVMSWRGEEGGIAAAKSGHKVVMTPTSYLYFDYYQGDPASEPMAIGSYLPLEKVYSYDPIPDALTPKEQQYIMGAQANVWTEYMLNEDKIEYMVFPRLSALSEVVWSRAEDRDWEDFKLRIPAQLNRYKALGINYAESIYNVIYNLKQDSTGTFIVSLANQLGTGEIRYTTDGSEVTKGKQLYSQPFRIEAGTVIRAQTFIEGETKGKQTEKIVKKKEA